MATAVFAARARRYFAAEPFAEKLHAIADAENRDAGIEDALVGLRRALRINARRSAGKNNARRAQAFQHAGRRIEADDLRVDVQLPHASRDDLRILRTKIENKDLAGHFEADLGKG